ncbi:ribonuclease H-like domain-containing protein [Tanacetum coccineum]
MLTKTSSLAPCWNVPGYMPLVLAGSWEQIPILNHLITLIKEVIVNGDSPAIASASAGTEGPLPPKIVELNLARKNELKAKKFGGNKESKKMKKTILKQQYKNFAASRSEGLDKTYDSSTNEAVNTAHEVSIASSQGQASSSTYIDIDDLEEMDLKWQVAILTTRVKLFLKKTGRNLNFNGKETVGFDKTNVKCYNCHRRGHFAKECRASRNQGNRNGDGPKRNALVDTSTTNALVVQDGIGYQIGLESLEARIVVHEKNEAVYKEDIAFLNAKDKAGLGYDSQMNKSEVVNSVFNSRESDVDNSHVNDRFKTGEGFHVVPPPYTRNYMPSRPDLFFVRLDDSVYKTKMSETITNALKTSKDNLEKPKTVRPSAPIIEDWDTNSDTDSVFRPKTDQTKPKFTKINFVKSNENVKSINKESTHKQVEYPWKSQSPRGNRRNWNGMMTPKLGNGFEFIKKACFVCGSFNHLIKDCDFHDNKMVEKTVLNNKGRVAVTTKLGQVPVNAAKQNSPRVATSISIVSPVNTAALKSKVNDALPKTYSYFKAHLPGNPQYTLQDQRIFDSRCSRHMTGNKSFLIDYQEIDGGFIAFGGSPKGGKITRKGKIRTGKLDFKDVYFVKELKFNLFCVSQMCDKKNSVLFTKTERLVLSTDFKLLDES